MRPAALKGQHPKSKIKNRWLCSRGQSTLEYAVFVAVVASAVVAMNLYVRRAVQANLKMMEERINAEAVK